MIKDRNGNILDSNTKESSSLRFLYNTLVGRLILNILIRPFASKLMGVYMNSSLSKEINDAIIRIKSVISSFE